GGRRLVVVGVGRIGSEIMRLGQAVGLDVLGVDLVPQPDVFPYAAFSEALPTADILVCAMNLTADNHGYFNAHALAAAKRGLIFVNVARGELAVEADLLRLLEAGRLGGVGLDVYGAEPDLAVALRQGRTSTRCALFHELAARPDVIMTPHNAFNTAEAVARKAEQSIMQLVTLASQGTFRWPVPIS
ncbi:MAG: hydroxyacid dehydrogenase, partial [Candidatus Marinimicrobia bacterium]|nr:hydroxyacid dehydrogenase [Candidatus Neomarinimicrobiota bacterium]